MSGVGPFPDGAAAVTSLPAGDWSCPNCQEAASGGPLSASPEPTAPSAGSNPPAPARAPPCGALPRPNRQLMPGAMTLGENGFGDDDFGDDEEQDDDEDEDDDIPNFELL